MWSGQTKRSVSKEPERSGDWSWIGFSWRKLFSIWLKSNKKGFIPRVPPRSISWWSHTQSPRQSRRQGWGKDSPRLPCHVRTLPSPPMITFPFCHDHWTSLSLIMLKILSTSYVILICILKKVKSDWVTSKEQPWSSGALTRTSLDYSAAASGNLCQGNTVCTPPQTNLDPKYLNQDFFVITNEWLAFYPNISFSLHHAKRYTSLASSFVIFRVFINFLPWK